MKAKERRPKLDIEARTRIEKSREVARYDMGIALASLFRPIKGRERREVVIEQEWNGWVLRLRGIELSDFDHGVLMSVLATVFQRGLLSPDCLPGGEVVPGLIDEAEKGVGNLAMGRQAATATLSIRSLCATLGIPESGDSWRSVRTSLERLSMVLLTAETGKGRDRRWATTRLFGASVGHGDEATVSLNYRLTRALIGEGSYAALSMMDYRSLETGVARLVYSWLTAWFASKVGTRRIGIEALERHVYGGVASMPSTRSRRRQALHKAVDSLEGIGWRVTWVDGGSAVEIERRRPEKDGVLILVQKSADSSATLIFEEPHQC